MSAAPEPAPDCLRPLVEKAWVTAIKRDFPVLLPIWSAQAVGEATPTTLDVAAGWSALYLAAKLLDDLQDGDPSILGEGAEAHTVLNAATALMFACSACLAREGGDPETRRWLAQEFAQHGLGITAGQEQGTRVRGSADPLGWAWRVMSAKGGRPFSLACRGGAISAGAGTEEILVLADIGQCIGEMIQLLDDLLGMDGEDVSDLRTGSMALAYGLSVAEADDRAELEALLAPTCAGQPEATSLAFGKLREMGADRYLRLEASVRAVKARRLLLHPSLLRHSAGWTALSATVSWLDPVGHHGATT